MEFFDPNNPNTGLTTSYERGIVIDCNKDNAPFSDKQLEWNNTLKMYVLTPSGFKELTGVDVTMFMPDGMKTEETAKFLLEEISERVYHYIYQDKTFVNVKYHEVRLAFDKKLRDGIKRALLHFASATLKSQRLLVGDLSAMSGYSATKEYDDVTQHGQRMLFNSGIKITANIKITVNNATNLPTDWEKGW